MRRAYEWITFIDPDDTYAPEFLEWSARRGAARNGADVGNLRSHPMPAPTAPPMDRPQDAPGTTLLVPDIAINYLAGTSFTGSLCTIIIFRALLSLRYCFATDIYRAGGDAPRGSFEAPSCRRRSLRLSRMKWRATKTTPDDYKRNRVTV